MYVCGVHGSVYVCSHVCGYMCTCGGQTLTAGIFLTIYLIYPIHLHLSPELTDMASQSRRLLLGMPMSTPRQLGLQVSGYTFLVFRQVPGVQTQGTMLMQQVLCHLLGHLLRPQTRYLT